MGWKIFLVYLVVLSLIGYGMMGFDKRQAKHHKGRVPEKRLFAAAFLGGALGSYIGMQKFRHKTKHLSFRIGIPLALLWSVAASVMIFRWLR